MIIVVVLMMMTITIMMMMIIIIIITYIIINMMMMMMMMTPRKTGIMATITESKKAATHPCEHTPRQSPKPDFKRNPFTACCYFFRFGSVPKRCIKTENSGIYLKRTQFQKINGWCLWCSSSANAFALPRFPENMQSSEWVPGCSACLLIYPATRIEQGWFYPGKSWKNEKTGWNLLYFRSGFWYQKFKEFVKQKCSLTAKVLTRFTLGLYGEAKVCPPPAVPMA